MTSVAIVGAGGYSGAELISILLRHPAVTIAGLFGSAARQADAPLSIAEVFPRFRGRLDLPVMPASLDAILASGADVVFLATPHEASLELAPALAGKGRIVLDLSAAFRLRDAAHYARHYGFAHTHAHLLESTPYGLPELWRTALRSASLIAVPGCYPTSSILPLRPLVEAGALEPGVRPVIDSISGVSGAGRSAVQKNLFCEVSVQPYAVLKHRHQPEIDQHAGTATVFTPQVGPYDRGIMTLVHATLRAQWSEARVRELYAARYGTEQFIRLLPAGAWPAAGDVRGTNFCDIALAFDPSDRHLIVASAIDNLVKGAAGQAVQCMNIRLGLAESQGLVN